jgi:hydrogenase expression/formation protein HypE
LHIANEGKLVAFVKAGDADKVLAVMKQTKYGEGAVILGRVIGAGKPQVRLKTTIGGTRLVDMLPGEMLPRIC